MGLRWFLYVIVACSKFVQAFCGKVTNAAVRHAPATCRLLVHP